MNKAIFLLLVILVCLSSSCNVENEGETVTSEPTAVATPKPTPNPNLSAEERTLIVQLYKEALMLNKRYEEAFETKDKDLFNEARGIGYALVRRGENKDDITDHEGMDCWLAFTSINGSRNNQWYDYESEGEVSDYSKEQIEKSLQSLEKCKSTAENTGILNDEELNKPLPELEPVEVE